MEEDSPTPSANEPLKAILGRIRRGGRLLFGGSGGSQALDLISTVLLTHQLGVVGFGVLVGARALSGLVNSLVGFRTWELLLAFWPRFQEKDQAEHAEGMYAIAVCSEVAVAVLGVLIVSVGGAVFPEIGELGERPSLLLAVVYLRHAGANVMNVNHAVLRLRHDYRASAAQLIAPSLLRALGLVVVIFAFDGDVLECAIVDGGAGALGAMVGLVYMGQSAHGMKLRPPMDLLRDSGRAFAHFVTMNWFVSSLKGASAYGAELCLVGLASAHEVGLFGLARRIGTFLNLGIDPLVHTVTPEVYRLSAAGNRRTLWRFLASVTAYASLILAVLGSGIFIWRHELIELVGGDEFGAAAPTLVVILMALTVQFLFYWLHPLMLAFHRMKTMIAGQVGLALGLVAGGFFWIPSHGATGAAIALGVGYACQSMVFAAGAVGLNPPAGGAETAATEPREDSGE